MFGLPCLRNTVVNCRCDEFLLIAVCQYGIDSDQLQMLHKNATVKKILSNQKKKVNKIILHISCVICSRTTDFL